MHCKSCFLVNDNLYTQSIAGFYVYQWSTAKGHWELRRQAILQRMFNMSNSTCEQYIKEFHSNSSNDMKKAKLKSWAQIEKACNADNINV